MKATAWILLGCLVSSCAYHFSSQDRRLPGGYDRIAVPMFKNFTQETGIESFFTSIMIEELQRDQFSKIVPREDAQVVLEAEVSEVRYERGAPSEDQKLKDRKAFLVGEYRIFVTVGMRLKRISDQKLLWSGNFVGEKQYPAPQVTTEGLDTANANYNHSARMQNLKILAKDVMTQAYINLTENF